MNNLLPLPVLLPLIGAAIALVTGRRPRVQRAVALVALLGVVAVAASLVVLTDRYSTIVLWVGAWPQPLGIALVADRLSSLMLLVSSVVTVTVLIFSMGQELSERKRETPVSIYHPTFLVLSAGVSNAFLAGDLFNLFVGFEILLFASYVLLTLGGTGQRVRAGTTYMVVSLLSSSLFLIAIACCYAATGTVNLAQLGVRLAALPPDVQQLLQFLLLLVFSIKAAVFPLSAWLPDSYPTAPAPVTAVFAGLLTKVGVYAIIRTQTVLFPDRHLSTLLLVAALLTMIIGILGAVAQSEIKRMLSFTLVSHIGYMIFGIALASRAGYAGAIFYTVHHITIQTTLFLVTGLVERRGGSTSLNKLGGLAALSPLLGVLFFVPAMNLAGIPPLSGFIGKVGLLEAGIAHGGVLAWTVVVFAVLTSLLTLYTMAKVWNRAFWRSVPAEVAEPELPTTGETATDEAPAAEPDEPAPSAAGTALATRARTVTPARRLPRQMVLTTAVLVLLGIGLTVVAGPLYGYTVRAAGDLLDPRVYIDAVLPLGIR
ncbi:multicomponent Na+:H+ antiporter subunit D [Friedmanniella endophytica]|uniref:Multicomponent Na+:H+ antiporter subunit D n=1 Tax=Microlunatus kandeliicorticis TaxID=1759536 RepID=A0A7W3IVI9_9ACTN|nr:Na+/H+ antiporter subunit D [Microlunatus kandeliicorticis]MBA8795999.1 multicomponent Na+:H+ antiporter subunit D [Microlunatus kandeliicorticis]